MARKSRDEGGGGDSWLNTYADLVTLLLTFFVLLFSMSSIKEEKWQALVKAFTNKTEKTDQLVLAPDGEGEDVGTNQGYPSGSAEQDVGNLETATTVPQEFEELYEYLAAYVEQNNLEGSVEVSAAGDSCVYIRFKNSILFNPDSSTLKKDSEPILDVLGQAVKQVEDQIFSVNVCGHTANIPNSLVSDRKLSSERAAAVAVYFQDTNEVDAKKILPIGYGNNYPIADNETPEGMEKNRRVELMIVSNDMENMSAEFIKNVLTGTYDSTAYPTEGSSLDVLLPDANEVEKEKWLNASGGFTEEPVDQPAGTEPPASDAAAPEGEAAPAAGAETAAEGAQPATDAAGTDAS